MYGQLLNIRKAALQMNEAVDLCWQRQLIIMIQRYVNAQEHCPLNKDDYDRLRSSPIRRAKRSDKML
jgi:hypothetical protein